MVAKFWLTWIELNGLFVMYYTNKWNLQSFCTATYKILKGWVPSHLYMGLSSTLRFVLLRTLEWLIIWTFDVISSLQNLWAILFIFLVAASPAPVHPYHSHKHNACTCTSLKRSKTARNSSRVFCLLLYRFSRYRWQTTVRD